MAVSTHSRPKAAGQYEHVIVSPKGVSTHSRPKAAGSFGGRYWLPTTVSTHSRPKAAGWLVKLYILKGLFQHTAARRRLGASAACGMGG